MHRRLTLAFASAIALSSPAFAQAPRQPQGPHHPPSPVMGPMRDAMMRQHVEDLKTVLRLRPDQEAALRALVAAHHPPDMDRMGGPGGSPEPQALTTPERLDRMARREADMTARRAQMRQALSKFYAALSSDQQKVVDALMRLQGPGHMGMMMGGPMMGGGGMMKGGPGGPVPEHGPD